MTRDLQVIDQELRLLAAVRWSIREQGGRPADGQVNALLDGRSAITTEAADHPVVGGPPNQLTATSDELGGRK